MNNMLNAFLPITLWSSAIIITVLILRRFLIHKLSPQAFKAIWLCLALRLIMPFDFSIENAPIAVPIPNEIYVQAPAPQSPSLPKDAITSHSTYSPVDFDASTDNSFKLSLPAVWLIVAFIFLSSELLGYFIFIIRLRKSRQSLDEDFAQICGNIKVFTSSTILSPLLCGYFKPAIYLPQKQYSAQEQTGILQHEMTHYKQGDLWFQLLLLAATSLSWFNPLVHIMRRKAICDIEMTVDEKMLKNADMQQRVKYGQMLFSEISSREGLLLAQYNSGKSTKQRFKAILSTATKGRGRILLCGVIALCAGISLMVSCAPKPTPQSDTSTPEITSSPISTPPQSEADSSESQSDTSEKDQISGEGSFMLPLGKDYIRVNNFHDSITEDYSISVDIPAPSQTPIFAVADGEITEAGSNDVDGNFIKIDHFGASQTFYSHCYELKVKSGQQIKKGDIIATVGNTGRSTGNHLHFSIGTGSKTMLDTLAKCDFEKDILPFLEDSIYNEKLSDETAETFEALFESIQNSIK